ncbi:MAG: class I SAM-dependent methyltransferase [Parcubacteria group bacterium]|jgi:ubiquinone/menaquinone biosynthesis C-methylase UbiE
MGKTKNSIISEKLDVPVDGAKFLNPEKIVKEMEIKPGMIIADFGCGTGYFCFPLAQKVGKGGKIYAIDILNSKLETVASQAKLSGINNIITSRANLEATEGSKLQKESVDWVILVNMLFQNNSEGKKKIMQEAKRVLKKGGNILVIEWDKDKSTIGPEKTIRVSKDEMMRIAREYGLGIATEIPVSDFHYGMILAKYKEN